MNSCAVLWLNISKYWSDFGGTSFGRELPSVMSNEISPDVSIGILKHSFCPNGLLIAHDMCPSKAFRAFLKQSIRRSRKLRAPGPQTGTSGAARGRPPYRRPGTAPGGGPLGRPDSRATPCLPYAEHAPAARAVGRQRRGPTTHLNPGKADSRFSTAENSWGGGGVSSVMVNFPAAKTGGQGSDI